MKKIEQKVYISCPLPIDIKYLEEVAKKVYSLGYTHYHHIRGTKYSDTDLLNADIIVAVLPNRKFKLHWSAISTGVEKEIKKAIRGGKPVYLAYWSMEGLKFYSTTIDDWGVSGIAGTAHWLSENHPIDEDLITLSSFTVNVDLDNRYFERVNINNEDNTLLLLL